MDNEGTGGKIKVNVGVDDLNYISFKKTFKYYLCSIWSNVVPINRYHWLKANGTDHVSVIIRSSKTDYWIFMIKNTRIIV